MTQAIVITAYRDEENLVRLIRHFATPGFRVFVHIDKKSNELSVSRLKMLRQDNLEIISKYRITWGSINHVKAVLELIRLAVRYDDVKYFHVVSGADIALHSPEWFAKRFNNCQESYFSDGILPVLEREHTVVWRTKYWMPSTWNPRSFLVRNLNDIAFWLQQHLGLARHHLGELKMEDVRFGMIWSSFPRGAGETMLAFAAQHPRFMCALNWTLVPEEAFFVTALMGSDYEPKEKSTDLRFYEWTREMPAILDENDWPKIRQGNYIFARKIDSSRSKELIKLVEGNMAEENSL